MQTPLVNPEEIIIACVLDASSSMATKVDEVITGVNDFMAKQKAIPGDPPLFLSFFNTTVTRSIEGEPVSRFNVLDRTNYRPHGYTALLDAVSSCIDVIASKFPGRKAAMCIVTDGEENSSRVTNVTQLRQKIEQKQGEGWVFIYLGAHASAFADARAVGIHVDTISAYDDKVKGGTMRGYGAANAAVSNLRSTGHVGDWKKDLDTPVAK